MEDIERELLLHPHLAKAAGLDKLRSPIQFVPEDLRDVILALHGHRQSLTNAFDSEHDFRDYPGLPAKNEINGLTAAYDAYIKESSMPFFPEIENFLKNPRNESLKEQYHTVADELKGQLIVHRDRFTTFDAALETLYNLIHERCPEIQSARLAHPTAKAAKDEATLVARNRYLLDEFPPRDREKPEDTTQPPTPPTP